MADGRMLKKVISDSKKLASLKSDSARLLWTWILPYLDIEGRYYADPDMIKGKVVPRVKTFTPENINDYLSEMDSVGLITLYESEGEKYLQFRNFKEFQNLRESKEAKSKIPSPKQVQDNGGSSPVILPNNIIKDNLIKEKLREVPEQPQPVDNSLKGKPALSEKQKEENTEMEFGKQELRNLVNQIQYKYPKLPILKFLQNHNRDHPLAIIHTLKSLLDHEIKVPEIPVLMKYLEVTITGENGKYNARDSENRCNEFKTDRHPMALLENIMSGMLKSMPAH